MSYSNKQALKLTAKIEAKYGQSKPVSPHDQYLINTLEKARAMGQQALSKMGPHPEEASMLDNTMKTLNLILQRITGGKIPNAQNNSFISKTANAQAILSLLQRGSGGTSGMLMEVANADQMVWDELIESHGNNQEATAPIMAAAKRIYDIIMAAAKAVGEIESKFD